MSSRTDLATALAPVLAGVVLDDRVGVKMVPTPRNLGEIDPGLAGVAQLVRREISPGSTVGRFRVEFDLWVVSAVTTGSVDPVTGSDDVEDHLDDLVDAVLETLDPLGAILWDKATRETHPDGYPAYRIELAAPASSVK